MKIFDRQLLFIGSKWVPDTSGETLPVINPATEEVLGQVGLASAAARGACAGFSATTLSDRVDLLKRIRAIDKRRINEIARIITLELVRPQQCRARRERNLFSVIWTVCLTRLKPWSFARP